MAITLSDTKNIIEGGIYSFKEHIVKSNHEIYNLLINRFNLKKETIFFDDKEKMLSQQVKLV